MLESPDFTTLTMLFKRASSLPALPTAALRLVKEIDEGEASAVRLERIICSDPALAAGFLRASNLRLAGDASMHATSVRAVIMLLGQAAVRKLALSLLVQNALSSQDPTSLYNRNSCARHSAFVGLLAQYVACRKQNIKMSNGSNNGDVFAAGVIHELPISLLAKVSAPVFNRVFLYARSHSITMSRSFLTIYGRPVTELGETACKTWGLPSEFAEYFKYAAEPWMAEDSFSLVSSVIYADFASQQTDCRIEDWPVAEQVPIEVQEEVGLPQEELEQAIAAIVASVDKMDDMCNGLVRKKSVAA